MNKHLLLLLLATPLFINLSAQSWTNGGNTLTANGTLGTNSSHSLIFETAGTSKGILTSSGRWHLGATTTPAAKVQITYNGVAGDPQLTLMESGNDYSRLYFKNTNITNYFGIAASPQTSSSAARTNFLYSPTGDIMTILGNKRVGIGTTNPATTFHVVGNSALMGNLGIGTTAIFYPLDIVNPNSNIGISIFNNFTGNEDRIGVDARSVNNPGWGIGVQAKGGWYGVYGEGESLNSNATTTGVLGMASGAGGTRYGIYGQALEGTHNYGVYGTAASGTTFTAAGYFSGNLYANGVLVTSDRKFKSDITPLNNALQQVMKLKPSAYSLKTAEYKGMHLAEGKQTGLIADEVKEVFPELVQAAVHPAQYDKNRKEISPEIKYEAVNYQGLIPVLVASVQELNQKTEEIAELKKELTDLKQLVSKLANTQSISTSTGSSALLQNTPNPVRGSTRITYSLPDGVNRAQLQITDALGRVIKTAQLTASGVVNFDASSLSKGVYNYSLIIDDKTIQTRKMTVVK